MSDRLENKWVNKWGWNRNKILKKQFFMFWFIGNKIKFISLRLDLKGQANVSIIIPNSKVYQSPQYSKKNKCHGHNFFPINRPLICPCTAPENTLAYPWHQRNIDAVDMTFFLMKLPPVCLWAAPESPQEKNKCSGHNFLPIKLPPICPWAAPENPLEPPRTP